MLLSPWIENKTGRRVTLLLIVNQGKGAGWPVSAVFEDHDGNKCMLPISEFHQRYISQ